MPIRPLLSTTMLSSVVGASFMAVMTAQAADILYKAPEPLPEYSLPAVDGFNTKFEGFGGVVDRHGIGGAAGSFSVPLGHSYGFQFDGTAAGYRGGFLGAAGAHLFWRDPAVGLLGVYGSTTYWDRIGGVHVHHAAVEFERYVGSWSIQGIAGVEWGNSGTGSGLRYDGKTRFFDMVDLSYYFTENTMLKIGHRYLGGKHALALGGEWSVPLAPQTHGSFFVEGRIGEHRNRGVWAGLRVYFGPEDKPLIRRHRESDPMNWQPGTLFGILGGLGDAPDDDDPYYGLQ